MTKLPPCLTPGDTLGVVAPSSPVSVTKVEQAIALVEARGYRVQVGDHLFDRHGYLAGSDRARAADLQTMLLDPNVHAVICARGGYGAVRLLEHLDWNTLEGIPPKVFVGFSDITTIHLALRRRLGWATYHTPVLTTLGEEHDQASWHSFWKLVESSSPLGRIDTGDIPLECLVPGQAKGVLEGGCLSMLCAAIGTPEQPDFAGALVLLEDTNEPLYRVDRYLAQLVRSGILSEATGFLLGNVTGWERDTRRGDRTLTDVWLDHLAPLSKPILANFPFGHEPNALSLPLGIRAALDAEQGSLDLIEPSTG